MIGSLKSKWEQLGSKQKRQTTYLGVGALVVLLVVIASQAEDHRPQVGATTKVRSITLEDDVLKKSIFAATNERMNQERKLNETQIQESRQALDTLKEEMNNLRQELAQGKYPGQGAGPSYPPAPGGPSSSGQPLSQNGPTGEAAVPPVRFTPGPGRLQGQPGDGPDLGDQQARGGIAFAEGPQDPTPKPPTEAVHKNYLPVSIIEAKTLTGIHATVAEQGMGNPQPVILRISMPAILPNQIKKNLKGCFVIAEGFGSLATERVELRTQSISCLSNNGQAVIEEPLKGFVVDGDGNLGLSGRVVARFGSTLARTALAGFFEGVGELTATSSQTTTTATATGAQTQNINPQDIAKGSLGKGLQKATGEIGKFYLALAKQALPVVEVLPGKRVSIIVREGVELKVNLN
ncbi:MAG: hypothetical protein A2600_09925 [Candidatus Lambdaproteobacteria bacterium RIFOXYD1_FULL_56_27]|uniref:Conjugal transfer protein TraB n=1 Tax=Candidatus Lambdaproteobacteria bacterium RIFOXYD2_FULL_56_26 TaxID=1817773 RepID=A0A1F6GUC4_9PROT|nr:MAG: hypothetical protein A2557_11765 [Candidatus Lambdaproteobacteria bacterium RIFOXYD2_FULL_56_26]OGH04335.1 MAG: hypothetical protein A2426_05780 [Candidatus Lambdaproteobacteria bacterium RIFOXYC1_FULL_56_13]OGH07397.1 MAG: hypothetical protein A2600_09925 [Candidatus Lambdaproteobacteria bacterium RIFOXYD1_FULL_56_27]